jgi:GntR family transcriptional regulator
VQGSGNYIQAKADPASVYAMLRIELATGGGLPTAKVLDVVRLEKDTSLPAFGTSPLGFRIRRLRFLSGVVAAVEEIWLDGHFAKEILASELSESLYLFYRQKLGLWIARAQDSVGQGPLPDWAPQDFPHQPQTPLPLITRISWDANGQSVELSKTWYDPTNVRYVARLK